MEPKDAKNKERVDLDIKLAATCGLTTTGIPNRCGRRTTIFELKRNVRAGKRASQTGW